MPDPAFGYLLWQTFVGAGFIDRDRMHAYAEKAMREAADGTGWIDPDEPFETAVHAAIDAAYDDPRLRDADRRRCSTAIDPFGRTQRAEPEARAADDARHPGRLPGHRAAGTTRWSTRTTAARSTSRTRAGRHAAATQPPVDGSGAAKLWLVSRALRLRRDRPDLFAGYQPLAADRTGRRASDRRSTAAARSRGHPAACRARRAGGWGDTTVALPAVTDLLTDRAVAGTVGSRSCWTATPSPCSSADLTQTARLGRLRSRSVTTFEVWAPLADPVRLRVGDQTVTMTAEGTAGGRPPPRRQPAPTTGSCSTTPTTDARTPARGGSPSGVHGPSRIYDESAFTWTDEAWAGRRAGRAR